MTSGLKKFIILFCISLNAFGQDKTIDSLKLALKNAKHDTTRCAILNQLVEIESDDVWPVYNEQLLKLAEAGCVSNPPKALLTIYMKYKANAFNNIGVLANDKGDIDKALIYYQKGLMLQQEINDKTGIAGSLNNLGFIYDHLGDIPKALEYYHKCLNINEKINNKVGVSTVLNNLGLIYKNQNEIPKAIEYYTRSLKICEEIEDVEGIGAALNNIGVAYDELNNIPKALEFYNKSLAVYKAGNNKEGVGSILNNIGMLHY